jgi:hypothetical protein
MSANSARSSSTTLGKHLAALAALAALKVPPVKDDNQVEALAPDPDPGIDADTSPEAEENSEEEEEETSAAARIRQVFWDALAVGRDTGVRFYERKSNADHAFRCAMPAIDGRHSIADFVACVTQGMLLQVFKDGEGTRLLYAAQVAYSTTSAPLPAPNPPLPNRRIHRKKSDIAS